MSSTPGLFTAFVDDAAVFPPGNAALDGALRRHRGHRQAGYAGCVGPLLVPASAAGELVALVTATPAREPLRVGVIGRPGTDPEAVLEAVDLLEQAAAVEVAGAETGWCDGWDDTLGGRLGGRLAVAVEIPRGAAADPALAQTRSAHREGLPVVAKFRTGPTPTWAWPDETELADFLLSAAGGVPFKLTGGLHHAVRGRYTVGGTAEENHGVLNVLLATQAARRGASGAQVAGLLARRDGRAMADEVSQWPASIVAAVRGSFTSFGCCEVTDPLRELTDLGLLPPDHHPGERP